VEAQKFVLCIVALQISLATIKTHLGLHVKSAHCFCQILTEFGISRQIFARLTNIKFHKNPSNWSRLADIYRKTDRLTDMTKLTGAFHGSQESA
jgi:hypothetical protein